MSTLLSFLGTLIGLAPKIRPVVEAALRTWGKNTNREVEELIKQIEPAKFDEIDNKLDKVIEDLDLPE